MIDKFTEIVKWIIDLPPVKAVNAILFILVIYFGWSNFTTQIENSVLQNEKNTANIDCVTKITLANIENQDKLTLQTKEYQERYDRYRDKVEQDNLETIRLWKLKYELVERKLYEAQTKQTHTEELVRKITNKLK